VTVTSDFTLARELHGVAHEVRHDLTNSGGVSDNEVVQQWVGVVDEFEPAGDRAGGEPFECRQHALIEIEWLVFNLHVLSVDLREVENVVEHGEERLATAPERVGEVVLLAIEATVQQHVGHADHAIQRRTNLVAHVRQKLALRPFGRTCFSQRQTQLRCLSVDDIILLFKDSQNLVLFCPGKPGEQPKNDGRGHDDPLHRMAADNVPYALGSHRSGRIGRTQRDRDQGEEEPAHNAANRVLPFQPPAVHAEVFGGQRAHIERGLIPVADFAAGGGRLEG
jgi:hypothetical protein